MASRSVSIRGFLLATALGVAGAVAWTEWGGAGGRDDVGDARTEGADHATPAGLSEGVAQATPDSPGSIALAGGAPTAASAVTQRSGPGRYREEEAVVLVLRARQAADGRIAADPTGWPCGRGEAGAATDSQGEADAHPSDARPPAPLSSPAPPPVPPAPLRAPPPFDPQDVLSTARAMNLLLDLWYTNRSGGVPGRLVSDGMRWLRNHQREDGSFGTDEAPASVLGNLHATAALTRILAMTDSPIWRKPAPRALAAVARALDPDSSGALRPGAPDFDEACMVAAEVSRVAAGIAAYDREKGREATIVPPLGLAMTLAAWADEPAPEGSSLELRRAMVRTTLGADPKNDPRLRRLIWRLLDAPDGPVVPSDPLDRWAAAVVVGTARYEEWGAWHGPFWKVAANRLVVGGDPCELRSSDGVSIDLRTTALNGAAGNAFGWTKCYGDPAPFDVLAEARRDAAQVCPTPTPAPDQNWK